MAATLPLVSSVRELAAKIKLRGRLALDEPMREHTSFRIGGPADLFLVPADEEDLALAWEALAVESLPVMLLGGGSNLLVADRGIRGAVVDLTGLRGLAVEGDRLTARAGTPMDDAVEAALAAGLSGLEFAASLPGSVGGATWMNACCYGSQMSDVLESVEVMGSDPLGGPPHRPARRWVAVEPAMWDYKRSPFQETAEAILRARFRLSPADPRDIAAAMRARREDRQSKGHFRFPCAGSVFKNNRSFAAPAGKLIDGLGLKGLRIGGAQVAPYHGNIIVNLGHATAADVRALMQRVEEEASRRLGLRFEREVILVGDW